MYQGWNCGDYFPDGITNGASWYSLSKGKETLATAILQAGVEWDSVPFLDLPLREMTEML